MATWGELVARAQQAQQGQRGGGARAAGAGLPLGLNPGGAARPVAQLDPNEAPNNLERLLSDAVSSSSTLQDVLVSLGQVGSVLPNVFQGEFGRAGRNLLQFVSDIPDAVLPGNVIPDVADARDLSSFSDVLKKSGVGTLGEFDLPLIGRVTGRGALGLGADIALDPLRFGRLGQVAKVARDGKHVRLPTSELAKTRLGLARGLARFAGDPVTALGRQTAAGQRHAVGFRIPFTQREVGVRFPGDVALMEGVGRLQEAKGRLLRPISTQTPIPEFRRSVESGLFEKARVGSVLAEPARFLFDDMTRLAKDADVPVADVFRDIQRVSEKRVSMGGLAAQGKYTPAEGARLLKIAEKAKRTFRKEVEQGFSADEVNDAMLHLVASPELAANPLGPQIALAATRTNRVYRDILELDKSLGVDVPPFKEFGLSYVYRLVPPKTRRMMNRLGIKDTVFTQLGKQLSRGKLQDRGKGTNRHPLLAGINVDQANRWFKDEFKTELDLFEPDARFALAGRLSRSESSVGIAETIRHLADTMGSDTTAATRGAGYIEVPALLDEFGFNPKPGGVQGVGGAIGDTARPIGGELADLAGRSLPPELVSELRRYVSAVRNPKTPGAVMRAFDAFTGAFKAGVTAIFPAFHVRNAASNVWANFLGDVSPKHYWPSGRILREYQKLTKARRKGQVLPGPTGNEGPRLRDLGISDTAVGDMTVLEFVDAMKRSKVFGFGAFSTEELLGTPRSTLQTERFAPPGIGRVPGLKQALAAGRATGDALESHAKIAHMLDKLNKGWSWEDAVASTKKHLFDYSNDALTPFERAYMRRVIPFWTFASRNLPLQLESLVTKPGKVAVLGHLQRALQRPAGDDEPVNATLVPEWMRSRLFGFARHNDSDSATILSGFGLGIEDLSRLDKPLSTFLGFLADMHPIPKAVAQEAAGKDFFTGKELRRMDAVNPSLGAVRHVPGGQAFLDWMGFRRVKDRQGREIYARADPRKLNLLGALVSPGSRVASAARKISRGQQQGRETETALNLLTGLQVRSLTPGEQAEQNIRATIDILTDKLRDEAQATGIIRESGGRFFLNTRIGSREYQIRRAKTLLKHLNDSIKAQREIRKEQDQAKRKREGGGGGSPLR